MVVMLRGAFAKRAHLNQVASKSEGMISMRPSLTAAQASAAMPPHDTHHCMHGKTCSGQNLSQSGHLQCC